MFDLVPFEHSPDLFRFFRNTSRRIAPFRIDVVEEKDAYLMQADLPGRKKEDIQLDVENDMLTITVSYSSEQSQEEKTYIRKERAYGTQKRSFDISGIRADKITAHYEDGVLHIRLPKKTPGAHSRRIEIS